MNCNSKKNKTKHLHIRITEEEQKKIEKNANRAEVTISEYIRNAALKEEK